jgi:hypothetical protein
MTVEVPEMITPEQLAEHTGWSARNLRELTRKIGACRIVGNRMLLTKEDIEAILEGSRPKPRVPYQAAPPVQSRKVRVIVNREIGNPVRPIIFHRTPK